MANESASKLEELLDALAEYAGDSKEKAREVGLKLLDRDGTKPIGEVIYKKGLTKRTADVSGKASELEDENKRLIDELADAKRQVKELESKEPNWQRRLEDNDRKWQAKLDAATNQTLEERRASLADKLNLERDKFKQALRIGQPGGVHELVGRYLPAEYRDQFVMDPETRSIKVREVGESDQFYDPAEGDPAEQLARDVISKLEPSARIMGDPNPGGGENGRVADKATRQIVDQKARSGNYIF